MAIIGAKMFKIVLQEARAKGAPDNRPFGTQLDVALPPDRLRVFAA